MLVIKRLTTKELITKASSLKVGEKLLISGVVFTARDSAHKRLSSMIENSEKLPIILSESVIYYAGPSEAPPGLASGSCGPTTSKRMDSFTPILMDNGLKVMIGKGERNEEVLDSIKKHKGVYLLAIGGAGALAAKAIKSLEVIAFEDLGTESIKKLILEDFPVFVGIDSEGNDIFKR